MVTEVMGDAIDDALEGHEEEEETEELVSQVLDEIRIGVNQEVSVGYRWFERDHVGLPNDLFICCVGSLQLESQV
ncbi:CHARGED MULTIVESICULAR BODY PROTEIN [Salix viminalis]|nr:CHARGED MULTIVESICULAR BODY PROTEIN [Salix viminalis]